GRGADPPSSGDELELVAKAALQVKELMVVLNKADGLSEAGRAEARAFTERVLAERLHRPAGRIFEVSATERLAAAGPARDWNALCHVLETLTARSGANMVRAAE